MQWKLYSNIPQARQTGKKKKKKKKTLLAAKQKGKLL
jgi:hypothetical protein